MFRHHIDINTYIYLSNYLSITQLLYLNICECMCVCVSVCVSVCSFLFVFVTYNHLTAAVFFFMLPKSFLKGKH